MAQRFVEGLLVVSSVEAPAQGFASVCKAIHEVAEKQVELHNHCVYRQNDGTVTSTCRGEIEVDGHQTECAQEDVAVDTEKVGRPTFSRL